MRPRVTARLLVLPLAVVALQWSMPPLAAADGGCASVSASAVDQYCEMVPTASGPRAASAPGAPLGGTLAASARRRLARTAAGRAVLLLPAARRHRPGLVGAATAPRQATVDPLGLGLPLLAVLAASGIALAALAARARRRRS